LRGGAFEVAQAQYIHIQRKTPPFTMKDNPPAQATEHVAASLDHNVARSQSIGASCEREQKQALSEHVEDKPPEAPLDPIAMLNDPDFAAKERALVRCLDMTFIPCLWILYFHNYLGRNNIA
jgi:hypothetical protein